jgi:flagellar protein FlgJ
MTVSSLSNSLLTNKINELPESKKQELKKLKDACAEFESIFMHQMLKEMRKTANPKNSLVYGGQAEEIFSDMLDQERSKEMKIGLGDMMFRQLSQSIISSTSKPHKK